MLKRKKIIGIITLLVLGGGGFFLYQVHRLSIAHSTFDNYYKFRGCAELIEKAGASARCRLPDGTTITLVEIDGKWYLENDGPGVW